MTEPLLPRIARADRGATEECIKRYGGLVWSLALKFCRRRADAEDAVQEVFIDLWKSAARFDENKASEKAFVAMIARRRLIDRLRARKENDEPGAGEFDFATLPSQDHLRMEASTEAQLAAKALRELPEERLRVLQLSLYQGLTHEQIASETGLPVGTVKSHVRRGLISVRERLRERATVGGEA